MLNWYKKAQAPHVIKVLCPVAWSMDHATIKIRGKKYVYKNVSQAEFDKFTSLVLHNNWDSAWAIISKWKGQQVEPEPKQQDNLKVSPTHQQEFDW